MGSASSSQRKPMQGPAWGSSPWKTAARPWPPMFRNSRSGFRGSRNPYSPVEPIYIYIYTFIREPTYIYIYIYILYTCVPIYLSYIYIPSKGNLEPNKKREKGTTGLKEACYEGGCPCFRARELWSTVQLVPQLHQSTQDILPRMALQTEKYS